MPTVIISISSMPILNIHMAKNKRLVNYSAIRQAFQKIALNSDLRNKKIGFPIIGAGLAGGDWNLIATIIDEETEGMDCTLVEYKPR